MIQNKAELEHSLRALSDIEEALVSLKNRVYPVNPELFEAMAESYYKSIVEIRYEIDTYLKKRK